VQILTIVSTERIKIFPSPSYPVGALVQIADRTVSTWFSGTTISSFAFLLYSISPSTAFSAKSAARLVPKPGQARQRLQRAYGP
jgi:hypothetical protein